jgi:diguanylate cyclase (GGDEF)-like protein
MGTARGLGSAPDAGAVADAEAAAFLVLVHGPAAGRRWSLERGALRIGRDESCDVVVPLDTVSRHHCEVVRRGRAAHVRDLGSTNGTFVEERALEGAAQVLAPGDRLRAGGAIFRFLAGPDVEAQTHEEIYRTMIVDGLTRAHNRRFLLDYLDRELARHQRHQRPLSVVLFDLDHFERLNDGWGQLTGDAVLRELAELVRPRVRREDCFARCGGEAFAIVLSETGPDAARLFAERLRQLAEGHAFRAQGERLPVTISVGLATTDARLRDPEALLARADARLREAKQAGRNRVAG